jgi:hypothetical protein
MCVRNIIPLPGSVAPTLKYYVGNIARRLISSFLKIYPLSHIGNKKKDLRLPYILKKQIARLEYIPTTDRILVTI